ncbi:MAG: hypothetical protein CL429_03760, partial [Acidimicrobiaceae bacterium]|nr:hypothetical protein [Acidimicrobiaceae bacterium]
KLAGWHLHEDTVICAAINGGEHGSQYQVGEMDPAELDRWTAFDVEPTVEDWLAWAKDNVDELIWDFINQNRKHLEHLDDFEPGKVYPSRRSWDRLNTTMKQAELFNSPRATAVFNLASVFVGFEAAVSLCDFIKNYAKIVTVEDILVNGSFELVEEFGINDHSALVEKMTGNGAFNEVLKKKELKNLAGYFKILPSEVAMKMWYSLTANGGDNANVLNLHPLIREDLVTMLTSLEEEQEE